MFETGWWDIPIQRWLTPATTTFVSSSRSVNFCSLLGSQTTGLTTADYSYEIGGTKLNTNPDLLLRLSFLSLLLDLDFLSRLLDFDLFFRSLDRDRFLLSLSLSLSLSRSLSLSKIIEIPELTFVWQTEFQFGKMRQTFFKYLYYLPPC